MVVNGFLMVVALISSILALIIAFIISRKFTGSILHMIQNHQKMKDLDFSEKCEIDSRDEFGQLAGSIDDLSESLDSTLKELGEKNEALKKEIEHKKVVEEMRKQFITNVSHELKTPLSLIQGYAEGLELNVASGEEKRAFYCSVIREETEKMGRLVKDLLDLSMMETGNFTLYKREFCIDELIRKVTGKFEKVLTENGIDLAYVEGEKTVVYADSFRTEQILTNYLDNAMHHVDERKEIRVRKDVQGNSVIVRVFNSGQNIPGKESEKIWTSFTEPTMPEQGRGEIRHRALDSKNHLRSGWQEPRICQSSRWRGILLRAGKGGNPRYLKILKYIAMGVDPGTVLFLRDRLAFLESRGWWLVVGGWSRAKDQFQDASCKKKHKNGVGVAGSW
jgi:signal transduction histidine kinase